MANVAVDAGVADAFTMAMESLRYEGELGWEMLQTVRTAVSSLPGWKQNLRKGAIDPIVDKVVQILQALWTKLQAEGDKTMREKLATSTGLLQVLGDLGAAGSSSQPMQDLSMSIDEVKSRWMREDVAESLKSAMSTSMSSVEQLRDVGRALKQAASIEFPLELAQEFLDGRPFIWKFASKCIQNMDVSDNLSVALEILELSQGLSNLPADPSHSKSDLEAPVKLGRAIQAAAEGFKYDGSVKVGVLVVLKDHENVLKLIKKMRGKVSCQAGVWTEKMIEAYEKDYTPKIVEQLTSGFQALYKQRVEDLISVRDAVVDIHNANPEDPGTHWSAGYEKSWPDLQKRATSTLLKADGAAIDTSSKKLQQAPRWPGACHSGPMYEHMCFCLVLLSQHR